jgi:hypothetical protein
MPGLPGCTAFYTYSALIDGAAGLSPGPYRFQEKTS